MSQSVSSNHAALPAMVPPLVHQRRPFDDYYFLQPIELGEHPTILVITRRAWHILGRQKVAMTRYKCTVSRSCRRTTFWAPNLLHFLQASHGDVRIPPFPTPPPPGSPCFQENKSPSPTSREPCSEATIRSVITDSRFELRLDAWCSTDEDWANLRSPAADYNALRFPI